MRKPIKDLPGEEWRDVAGTGGKYQVSNMGRVKSFKRREPALITPTGNGSNYWQVAFRVDGRRTVFLLHRLVMLTFSPIENADVLEVNHLDFDHANCALSNLEWATRKENREHFLGSGRTPNLEKSMGSNHFLSKLTDEQVIEIRRFCKEQGRGAKIFLARKYGLNRGTIENIVKGFTWKHLLPADDSTAPQ